MAYDKALSGRIQGIVGRIPGISSKEMFGGMAFMLNGNVACGVIGEYLMVRVGPAGQADALAQEHTRPFDYSGKPMNGWIYVMPGAIRAEAELEKWVQRGLDFAGSLPPK
jgi:hypothetical protein